MYFSSLVFLLVVSNISFSIGFPFFIRTFPKNVVRYNNAIPAPIRTIPNFPLSSQFHTRGAQTQYSFNNKVDNVFSDDQYIEQRKIDDRDDSPSDESSDLHPIYVLPPPNFQPIVYPTSRSDSTLSAPKVSPPGSYVFKPQLTYEYPKGLSSWILGGLTGPSKNNYWDQLSKDLAHLTPVRAQQPKQVVIYLKSTEPKGQHKSWPSFPVYEAHSVLKEQTNTINTILNKNKNKITNNNNKGMKTKLPVGMTSFFLGGMRGVSGRHWQMPATLVSQIEFMPNDNTVTIDNKKYKPGVQFDDDNDFYNYNVIRDHK